MLRNKAKKIKFHIFRFHPTFSMLSRKVVSLQKYKKHLCCNLFWVSQKYLYFDWAMIALAPKPVLFVVGLSTGYGAQLIDSSLL